MTKSNSNKIVELYPEMFIFSVRGYEHNIFEKAYNKVLGVAHKNPSNIIVGLTNSSSIYFRFYNFPSYETHLEVFYTKDDEDDNIEAVATVYQRDKEVLKKYGTLDEVFQEISSLVKKSTNQL